MKKILAFFLVAGCGSANAQQVHDLTYAMLTCNEFTSASAFVKAEAATLKHPRLADLTYFPAKKGVEFKGLPVYGVFGYQSDSRLFERGPGTEPPHIYGITIEGTVAGGEVLVRGSRARVSPTPFDLRGHAFIDISCEPVDREPEAESPGTTGYGFHAKF
ncbi:hypothetical protein JM78_04625 [Burkholderia pyrrocinia]|uniref:hypothetical protein n=1 Tax=Burkholderia pyrrocinia TaxID=60550 RepID=UPI0005011173|nr:hypothetical protein [Burkholderia pyrrocinia]KFL54387.1 hypothetical protein JM78_04625 [Burkholderia pyrrocinia]